MIVRPGGVKHHLQQVLVQENRILPRVQDQALLVIILEGDLHDPFQQLVDRRGALSLFGFLIAGKCRIPDPAVIVGDRLGLHADLFRRGHRVSHLDMIQISHHIKSRLRHLNRQNDLTSLGDPPRQQIQNL